MGNIAFDCKHKHMMKKGAPLDNIMNPASFYLQNLIDLTTETTLTGSYSLDSRLL